jgi:hypothetical protein
MVGLLKGRFHKHLWAVMWIWCCIILHNLILRIEAGNINSEWQEELYQIWNLVEGAAHRRQQEEAELGLNDESKDESELQHAHCKVMSDGQKFHRRVMNNLFNSPTSGAIHRT